MHRLSSSLRHRSPQETLRVAKKIASGLGVTRVTDTTWLDRIGIPVFASIRPDAKSGSLCVNAGKGLLPDEAIIGAYMEAIEFSLAEFNTASIKVNRSTPRKIVDSHSGRLKFSDFCLSYGMKANPDSLIMSVSAEDLINNCTAEVPAELVFIPYSENHGQRLFGESSNGLASGNDLLEASLHGLCELIERDIQAFDFIKNKSILVDLTDISPAITSLVTKIHNAGLQLSVRYTHNEFNLPYFQAFIMESFPGAPVSIASGSGCHLIKEIALIRAICEAAQSRLSHIHGGRDDIIRRVKYFERAGRETELDAIGRLREQALNNKTLIQYDEIKDQKIHINTIANAWEILIDLVKKSGVNSILRIVLTPPDYPIQVVRILAPKLESFDQDLKRVGPRLKKYVQSNY